MAPPSSQREKGQQTLSRFFSPKATINGLAANLEKSRQSKSPSRTTSKASEPTSSPSLATRKRPLEEDSDWGNGNGGGGVGGLAAPGEKPPKRSRSTGRRDVDDDDHHNGENEGQDEPAVSAQSMARTGLMPQSSSSRTDRFMFGNSQQSQDKPRDGPNSDDNDDEDALARKALRPLHEKFVAKLGHPDSMMRFRKRVVDASPAPGAAEDEDEVAEEDDEESAPATAKTAKGKKKGGKSKLTPMEIQFLDIKRKHMDTVLIVEVGYKFRFFGEDARIAAKELSIVCIPGKYRYDEHASEAHLDRFASASIPVHRLPVHAKRLVAAGYKVGVVRQVETAALKKAGDNRNAPFVRKLTALYTKGTYVDEAGELDHGGGGDGAPAAPGYLLCLTEKAAGGAGVDERVSVGVVAVQPATGDIIYDSFEDGLMRAEIETRLLHISPCEFLIVGDLTPATEKLVRHLSGSATNVFGDRSRVERVGKSKTAGTDAYTHVTQFYAGKVKEEQGGRSARSGADGADGADSADGAVGGDRAVGLLDTALSLPESVTVCLSAMITHLTEFGLEHIFDLTKYFQSFTARTHMAIGGTTLESLEVYRNSTDHAERGSLFWAIDKTTTRPGQRLLRKWVGRPLLDKQRLDERVAAVEELLTKRASADVDRLEKLLRSTKADLERSLTRIYYGKCTRPELLAVLQALQRVATPYASASTAADTDFDSPLLSSAVLALGPILPIVLPFLDQISAEAARRDDKYGFLRDGEATEAMIDHQLGIAGVEQELDAHRTAAAEALRLKRPVDYVTVAGIEYLIEVANADVKRVPASWAKVSGTKKVSRFHTPDVLRLMAERDQHREALAAACDAAFAGMLADVGARYQPLRDAVAALSTLDCLLSLSRVAALPGYVRPTILPTSEPPQVRIAGGRHPMAEHTLPDGYIPFSATLESPAPLAHLVTGPNMGGKSSFVRAVALLVLLAQVGSYVPADSLTLTLADAILTRMGARDNLFAGESTFMVEVSETARILRAATPRSLVVLDELGRGTSTHDGAAIAHAVLEHVARETRCLTLFITHYQNLARVADGIAGGVIKNVHMRFAAHKTGGKDKDKDKSAVVDHVIISAGEEGHVDDDDDDADDADAEITFLYEVGEGVAHRSYGLNVARLARIPRRVLDVAAHKSRELEAEIKARKLAGAARLMDDVLGGSRGEEGLEQLISSIEQL